MAVHVRYLFSIIAEHTECGFEQVLLRSDTGYKRQVQTHFLRQQKSKSVYEQTKDSIEKLNILKGNNLRISED